MVDSVEDRLGVLTDYRRRVVIDQLRRDSGDPTTLDELVDRILAEVGALEEGSITDRGELALQLHHRHLPKLSSVGVVEYDHRTRTVQYLRDARLESVLEQLADSPLQTND